MLCVLSLDSIITLSLPAAACLTALQNDCLCLAIFASFHQMAFDACVAISAGKPETCFVMVCPLPAGSHTLPFD
jgi:hypothetical protein